ncbi:olfactory receptor 51G2-like [Emydura macquarii macquarii]|uniref:olfactory receptor 51G2-like n=1 Tax=Emydura macquarii macquarii TaxID=1129001 RepID=UPI00352B219B
MCPLFPNSNKRSFSASTFILIGVPDLKAAYVWLAFLLCSLYLFSILRNCSIGNSLILFIIKTDPTLHEPMYLFLFMLSFTDIGLMISNMPTTLGIIWFNSREISYDACFAQLFFIHSLTFTESSLLLSMAFDRFVAICHPLRYASILTLPRIAKMGLVCLLRGVFLNFHLPILLKQYRYCKDNILYHSYCLHQEVMTMACSDIRVNIIYGFFVTVSSVGLDVLLILLSYVMILKTVLSITSHAKRLKALNTCVSHVCVVLLFYMPVICLSVIYRFVKSSSPLVQNVLGDVYLLIPPLMNPIVYSVKTKHIRVRIIRLFIK